MARPITPAVLGAALLGTLTLTPAMAVAGPDPAAAVPSATTGTGELPPARPVTTIELTTDSGAPVGDVPATAQPSAAPFAAQDATLDVVAGTGPLETEEFFVAALTWDGELAEDTELLLRTRTGEEWGAWAELEEEASDTPGVAGTEPYVAAGATGVQVTVAGDRAPSGLELHLIPANPAAGERDVTLDAAALPSATTNATQPGVLSRRGWGADESLMTWTPTNDELRAAVVHHTAGTNDYRATDSASIVRGIYHYHAVTRGWGDIGYNFLVDKYGQVFEGRSGSLASAPGRMPEAAHARGFNSGTLGISVLGDYSSLRAPQLVLDTMAEVIAWQFSEAGLRASQSSGLTSPGTAARPAGQLLPRIFAHRDVGATTCPGNDIYSRIPALVTQVDRLVERGSDDVVEYHLKNSLLGGPADLMLRLGLPTDDVLVGDWDGDGVDTLALRRGNEYHVYDTFRGGPADRVVRYGRADDVVLVGDWDGDGRDTFAVRRGREYHVKNSIAGGPADRLVRYGRPDDVVLVGDWDGDGVDTFAVRRGSEYHVRNVLAGGEADVVLNYGRSDDVVLVGDWDGDGVDTFAVRRGNEYHVRNALAGGQADSVFRYGRADDVVLVGDWDGDRRDTLGVRRD